MGRPDGILIEHGSLRSLPVLVVMPDRPYLLSAGRAGVCDGKGGRPYTPAPILDCSCGVVHTHKTIHLFLDDLGQCLVSEGVLNMLKEVGLENAGLKVVGHTRKPPTIELGLPRQQVDYVNRAYKPLTPIVPAKPKLAVVETQQPVPAELVTPNGKVI